ncbi:MAG: hypothetical protein RL038_1039 [Actinomycetota bacterium]|jgi:lipoyl(octanoyl) transferase
MSELRIIDETGKLTDFAAGWEHQRELHAKIAKNEAPSTVILLEHSEVFTAGKRTQASDLPVDGSPVIDVDRGGRITWHGPGQLVGYPLVKLPDPIDVMEYVHKLELALMDVCASFGLETIRIPGRTGVWRPATDLLPERKIAAIGVRVSKGVTMHGFALNCNPDLSYFNRIVPCGIDDAGVTSLTLELQREVKISDVKDLMVSALNKHLLGWSL